MSTEYKNGLALDSVTSSLIVQRIRRRRHRNMLVFSSIISLSCAIFFYNKYGSSVQAITVISDAQAKSGACSDNKIRLSCVKVEKILSDAQEAEYKKIFATSSRISDEELLKIKAGLSNKILASYIDLKRLISASSVVRPSEYAGWLTLNAGSPFYDKVSESFKKAYPGEYSNYGQNSIQKSTSTTIHAARAVSEGEAESEIKQVMGAEFSKLMLSEVATDKSFSGDEKISAPTLAGKSKDYFNKGLLAWKNKKYREAAHLFNDASNSEGTSSERASASFWAFRSHIENGDFGEAQKTLDIARKFKPAFYGLIAEQVELLKDSWMPADNIEVDADKFAANIKINEVIVACALAQIGEKEMAEGVLLSAAKTLDISRKASLSLVAQSLGIVPQEPEHLDVKNSSKGASLKMPRLAPEGGFKVDPALVYAIVKNESGFAHDAESNSGAVGLMQIMPETAGYISNNNDTSDLQLPAKNLKVGQQYISYLMKKPDIGDNLFYLLAAYNAGPGKMSKWRSSLVYNGDPLLFLESIPYPETKDYVANVITDYWRYKSVMNKPHYSMLQIASGNWPRYENGRKFAMSMMSPEGS